METHDRGVERRLCTGREVAEMLAVSRGTVGRLVAEGRLEPVRFGRATRYRLADVERLIAEGGAR